VATVAGDGRAIVTVANTGPVVTADEIEELFVPFRRLGTERTSPGDGLGLGLSIVKAIADAHGVAVTPQAGGGLRIEVGFPDRAAEAREVPWQRAHLLSSSSALLRRSSAQAGRTGWRR
jgi:signal transduction histidine kinase